METAVIPQNDEHYSHCLRFVEVCWCRFYPTFFYYIRSPVLQPWRIWGHDVHEFITNSDINKTNQRKANRVYMICPLPKSHILLSTYVSIIFPYHDSYFFTSQDSDHQFITHLFYFSPILAYVVIFCVRQTFACCSRIIAIVIMNIWGMLQYKGVIVPVKELPWKYDGRFTFLKGSPF